MDLFETIKTRKTIRKYKEDSIPMEDVYKIIDCARLAPSATNSQNWKFIAITNKEIKEQMKNAVVEEYDKIAKTSNDEEFQEKIKHYKNFSTFFSSAPLVIAAVETKRVSFITEKMKTLNYTPDEIKYLRPDSSLLSLGGAIENMSLAAHALGYGSCWLVAPIIASNAFSSILKLNNGEHVISLLSIGIPENTDTKGPKKKPLEDVMQIID